jgi:hypothetical protein
VFEEHVVVDGGAFQASLQFVRQAAQSNVFFIVRIYGNLRLVNALCIKLSVGKRTFETRQIVKCFKGKLETD